MTSINPKALLTMPNLIRLLLAFVLLTLVVNRAESCSCSENTGNIKEQIRSHNLIFSGKLIGAEISKRKENGHIVSDITFIFVTDKFWRGIKKDTIVVKQGYNFLCGPHLPKGSAYIVYMTANGELSSCGQRLVYEKDIARETQRLDKVFTRKRFKQLQTAS